DARQITHDEHVGAIAKRPGETDIRTGPFAVTPRHLQTQRAVGIDAGVRGVVFVHAATAVARTLTYLPLITAERQWRYRSINLGIPAFDRRHRHHALRQFRQGRRA